MAFTHIATLINIILPAKSQKKKKLFFTKEQIRQKTWKRRLEMAFAKPEPMFGCKFQSNFPCNLLRMERMNEHQRVEFSIGNLAGLSGTFLLKRTGWGRNRSFILVKWISPVVMHVPRREKFNCNLRFNASIELFSSWSKSSHWLSCP